jgi:hypothetical protein
MNIGLSAIAIFRFVMYSFALDMNTRIKFSPETWNDEKVQEVAYEWSRALRLLFGFRLLATFIVCYGGDIDTNLLFLLGTLVFNLYFLLHLFGVAGPGIDGGKVIQPQNINVPKILTTLDFLGPLFCVVYYYFFI